MRLQQYPLTEVRRLLQYGVLFDYQLNDDYA